MTAKRFTDVWCSETGHIGVTDNGIDKELTGSGFEDLLNELNDKYIDEYAHRETLQQDLQRVEEENEQLKYQNEMLSDELQQCKAVINKEWSKYLKKKEKEVE